MSAQPVKYHMRPGYHSTELLIEFISGVGDNEFNYELEKALQDLNLRLIKIVDLWVNDEISLTYETKIGRFNLT